MAVTLQSSDVVTCPKAHPVGMKARILTNISPIVRLRRAKRIPTVPTKPMKSSNLRSRNMSWKSALNFFLPSDTTCVYKSSIQNVFFFNYYYKIPMERTKVHPDMNLESNNSLY